VSHKAKNLTPKRHLIQTLINPPKEVKGEREANRKGYTVQRVIHGRHTGESNSVTV